MQPRSLIIWIIILIIAFALGFWIMSAVQQTGREPIQNQPAPNAPTGQ